MRRVPRVLLATLALLGAALAWGEAISYTVQVVALSDKQSALDLQAQLNAQGFPAYVVRSSTPQGDVYRVRAGAFANRQAALVFAEAMPEVAGGRPVPALAEAIPPGIVALAPRVLTRIFPDGRDVTLLPWRDGWAVRLQAADPLAQARYVTLLGGAVDQFDAWLAVPQEDGSVTRVRDLALWPDTYATDAQQTRDAYRTSILSLVAEGLGLPLSDVEAAEYQPTADAAPKLVVLERAVPGDAQASSFLALGVPELGMSAYGPVRYLGLAPGELPDPPEGVPLALDAADASPLAGQGWTAASDDGFVRLTQDGGASWRAGVGVPIWTDGSLLVTVQDGSFLFYDFVPR